MEEIWKPVVGYEGLYEVSSLGRAKWLKHNKILKPFLMQKRYLMVNLSKEWIVKNITIHRMVVKAFIPNPKNKPQVNHKNWIKTDNRLENLEWCTSSENHLHSYHELWIDKYSNLKIWLQK